MGPMHASHTRSLLNTLRSRVGQARLAAAAVLGGAHARIAQLTPAQYPKEQGWRAPGRRRQTGWGPASGSSPPAPSARGAPQNA